MPRKKYKRRKVSYTEENDFVRIKSWITIFLILSWYAIYEKYILPNIEKVKFYTIIFLFILLIAMCLHLFYLIKKRKKLEKLEEERIANIPNFLLELENKIKQFKPIRQYKEEKLYQTELVGFLKNNYSNLKIEETIDYSRPDIIIDDIAIEIKWPTNMTSLKTIPDKINSYLPKWNYLFIVLFNIQISKEIYDKKKQEIIENTIDDKKDKIFFIEIS